MGFGSEPRFLAPTKDQVIFCPERSDDMAQEIKSQLGRLRSQAHLIRTSIEALIGIARFQAVVARVRRVVSNGADAQDNHR